MRTLIEKIGSVLERRNPEGVYTTESFAFDEADDITKYLRLAMEAVDERFTNKSKEAGERVRDHLKAVLPSVSFRYQGSVMTDTHIKGASDIDLLVICEKFFSWSKKSVEEALASNNNKYSSSQCNLLRAALQTENYKGDVFEDLYRLRQEGENTLSAIYDYCDLTKGKSIKITNQNLNREVDVVVASWYDDVNSFANGKRLEYRGIQVFNKLTGTREHVDYPFRRAKLLNERSAMTQGRLKKMIRLLKTLKAESTKDIDFSSFDIYALCYAMPICLYENFDYIHLVPALAKFFYGLVNDVRAREQLRSVDGEEKIFTDDKKTKAAWELYSELYDTYVQLRDGGLL